MCSLNTLWNIRVKLDIVINKNYNITNSVEMRSQVHTDKY